MTYDPTWIRKSPILIPQAVQNESLTAQKGSVRLDALDWGQKVGAVEVDLNQGGGSCLAVSPFNNGKMFVVWSAGTSARYAIVDSNGNIDSTTYQTFVATGFLDYSAGLASVLLPNGNIVVAYGKNQGANNAIVFKIVDENGDVVRDEVTVKTHATETHWGVGLAALPDGRFVVTWQEAAAGSMSYFAIYDMDGDVSKGYTSLGGNYGSPKPAPLSDGNWIVTYENSGNIMFRTYDRQGIQIIGETLFRSGASQAPGMRTLGNGQIVVPFTRGFGIIDRQGNVVVAPEVKDSTGSYAITVLPHDNIVTQNNSGTSGTYKIYDSAGTLVDTQTVYAAEATGFSASDTATFKNGNFILAYVTGGNVVKFYIHQGTKAGFGGDLSIEGYLSLASGASVNEVSTDNTLAGNSDTAVVTEKAIKYYVDNSVGSLSHVRIYQDDSEVRVTDDGTSTPNVDVKINNTSVADFTDSGLAFATGTRVNEFSTDTTLADDSNTAVPTEHAVKTYVDTSIGAIDRTIIYDGDSSVHVIDSTASTVNVTIDGTVVAAFASDGLTMALGTSINEFSIDGTLVGDSDDAVPTEKAVKTYVDTAIANLNPDKIWQDDSYVEVFDDGTTTPHVDVVINAALVATYTTDGLTLSTGASVNEFSIDGTLVGDSDDAVPTEKAVKTYVDTSIAAIDRTIIYEGDSYVHVVDDGTAAGYVSIVTDGVEVGYYDAQATSQRMGKAPGSGGYSVKTSDSAVVAQDTSGNAIANLTQNTQTIGLTATNVALNQTANSITLTTNTTGVASFTQNVQSIGVSGDTYVTMNQTNNTYDVYVGATQVIDLDPNVQVIGVAADTFLSLTQDTNTVDLRANNVSIFNATDTTQRLGVTGDTALTLNTAADTFTLSAGATTMVSGTTTSISLGVSGDTSITLDSSIDQVAITAGGQSQILVETSGTTIYDDLTVTGDLFVDGTTFVVNQTEVRTADNVIVVNYGEPGAGVTAGTAGMQVDRGTLPDYFFVFAENTDTFRIGEEGATQAVATREDNPNDLYVPYWNNTLKRYDTAGNTHIAIDQTSSTVAVTANSVQSLTISENGITLLNGTTINEFSTDTTLAGDSNSAVPTEHAIKTYIDSMIFSGGHLISQGDSKVEVYDTTGTAHVDTVVDGTVVEYLSADSQILGVSGDTLITLSQSGDTIVLTAGNTTSATFGTTGVTLATGATINEFSIDGTLSGNSDTAVPTEKAVKTYVDTSIADLYADKIWEGDSYVEVVDDGTSAGYITFVADGVEVAHYDAQSSTQRIGKAAESRMLVADDTVTFYAGASPAVQVTLSGNGFALATGETVNSISLSTSLGTSNTTLVTQGAVKSYADTGDSNTLSSANGYTDTAIGLLTTYVNNEFADTTAYIDVQDASTLSTANNYTDVEIAALRRELDLINIKTVTTDSTAVTGDVVLVDTTTGDVTIEMQTADDSRIIIKKKTTDGNKVNIVTSSGTIDGQNLIIIDTPYQSFTFVSDGSNYYII